MFDRLFRCPCTRQEREATFSQEELLWLEHNPCRAVLLQGLQLLPDFPESRPPGIGYEPYQTLTLSGRPVEDELHGTVYTDGSCLKPGAPTWNTSAWAVVKISTDGILLAWAAGVVGRGMPKSSPASENVAGLAAATLSPTIKEARTDYAGLEGLHNWSLHALSNRKSPYAGVHRQIRGRAPAGFTVVKVRGHAQLDDCRSHNEWLDAVGNDFADKTAKAMAHSRPQPSPAEIVEWNCQQSFLRKYSLYIPFVLSQWPANSPSQGHKSIPKRADADLSARLSFLSDLLGPWRAREQEGKNQSSSKPGCAEAVPSEPLVQPKTKKDPVKHVWRWQAGRWLCTNCLATSRTTVPRQIFNALVCPRVSGTC